MALSAKMMHTQLMLVKPLLDSCSLETIRKAQDKLGDLMGKSEQNRYLTRKHSFEQFEGSWVIPKDERRQGVILYLHGGGFVTGGTDYAQGVGAMLAVRFGTRVFCPVYRLAPEHPAPAQLTDALCAYEYLLKKGYSPEHIMLCGESAGGGLCYSLCLELKKQGKPLPCGIIAISPWTDLTSSGSSYEENREKDPSMTQGFLNFCADHYTKDRKDPTCSPLFADLQGMPPSCIFVGADEIMRSDSTALHEKLLECGCKSTLTVAPDRWHGYILFNLKEDQQDLDKINDFLNKHLAREQKLRWMKLDNAAKIYPAARRQNWTNMFRLSVSFRENVDSEVLQSALDVTVRRFPSIAARLRRGVFWYYLQQLEHSPQIQPERNCPISPISRKDIRKCALRVLVYENRMAVEFFHSLTDGTGGTIFIKTLAAEYICQKYGESIPAEQGVLGRLDEPSAAELEDSFPKYAGPVSGSRKDDSAWRLSGTPEQDGFLNVTCFEFPVEQALAKAHEYGVSMTSFLTAAMMDALQQLQKTLVPNVRRRKPIKVQVPVNLRRYFPSQTLRNFAYFTNPQINPRQGEYEFGEICKLVHHWMGLEATPRKLATQITANVRSEQSLFVKIIPLFIKNAIMKAIFNTVGEQKMCLCFSNLGAIQLPEVMKQYITRMDFILSAQATAPYNCSALSYGDTVYVNLVRSIRESDLELEFYKVLQRQGLDVLVRSNRSSRP